MHAFITHLRAKPGKREEVMALTRVMLEKTRSEAGIPIYLFHTATDQPDDFWFYDLYESEQSQSEHEASAEFQRTMPALMQIAELVSVAKLDPYGPMKIEPLSGSED